MKRATWQFKRKEWGGEGGKRKGNEDTQKSSRKREVRVVDSSHRSEEEEKSGSGDADYARLENEQNRGGSVQPQQQQLKSLKPKLAVANPKRPFQAFTVGQ